MDLFLTLLSQYGYLALFCIVLVSGMYVPIPAGIVLIAVGAFSHHHYFSLGLSFLVALVASMVGDLLVYTGSRKVGTQEWCSRFMETNQYAGFIEQSFKRRPMLAVALSRFLGFAHLPMSMLAGLSRMPVWKYALAAFPGNALCIAFYLIIGYTLGLAVAHDVHAAMRVIGIVVMIGVLGYLGFFFISRRQKKGANQV